MAAKGYTYSQLAIATGCTRQNVREFATGRVPGPRVASRLADALDDPELLQLVLVSRRIACLTCGRKVIAETARRRYCSDACGQIGRLLGKRAPSETEVALMWERNGLASAIDAMCRACEPDGLCRTESCPLRVVSPFPYSAPRDVLVPPARNGWENPARRAAMARFMEAEWSTNRAKRTAAITAGIRQARRRVSPEVAA